MKTALQRIRQLISKLFHRFGIHCATHQIRLILISALFITSLFYPALAIYSSANPKPLSHFSSRLLDSFIDPDSLPLYRFEDDVRNFWSGHDALRIRDDSVTLAGCGKHKTIRLERVLISSINSDDDAGAINHQTLLSTLKVEKQLTDALSSKHSSCLAFPNARCIAFSPLGFWSHDEATLMADTDLLRTVNTRGNISVMGIPIVPAMTLAGRDSSEHGGSSVDFAAFLALTYLFHEDDCLDVNGHNEWLNTLDNVISQTADINVKAQEPSLLALEFEPHLKPPTRVSVITLFTYLSYIVFFVFFSGSMRRMDTVHSRVGLCFTGLMEILVSTIASLSVCAIGGLRITLVPWSILPVAIVYVGAENMFRLIDEVVKTPISLPVKERIGVGLSRAGTSNTLKVVSYNAILGVIAVFASGAIRQFCVFAIVVLVAHWFLIHTFFVAVLSIDIQRLELDDILRQDISLSPITDSKKADGQNPTRPSTTSGIVMASIKNLLRGRITKNLSLLLLLAITGTLYYATQPSSSRLKNDSRLPLNRASIMRTKAEFAKSAEAHPEAWHMWKVFNPHEDPLLFVRIEAPVIATLRPEHGRTRTDSSRPHRSRLSLRALRPILWLSKIMILPIGTTIGCLYMILLYLLKDAELREAQRNRAGPDDGGAISGPVDGNISFKTLPRTFATDLMLIASSKDGKVVASVSLEGEVTVWLSVDQVYILVDTTDLLLRSATTSSAAISITSVTLDDEGKFIAVGTGTGIIGVWKIEKASALPLPHLFLDYSTLSVSDMELIDESPFLRDTLSPEMHSPASAANVIITILATYDTGATIQWTITSASSAVTHKRISPSRTGSVVKSVILRPSRSSGPLVVFILDDGSIDVCEIFLARSNLEQEFRLQAGQPLDTVVHVHACIIEIDRSPHTIVAAATRTGVISLWDCSTQECISKVDGVYGPISRLRLLAISPRKCSQCGEVPMASFILTFSVGHSVYIEYAHLSRRCLCPVNQRLLSNPSPSRDSVLGRRSRNSSFISSSVADSLQPPRSRLNSLTNGDAPSFPVSGHGGHSRRGSDKDLSRRYIENQEKGPIPLNDVEQDHASWMDRLDPFGNTSSHTEPQASSLWQNFKLVRVGEPTCERGGWDLMGNRILGLRRKSRIREPLAKDSDSHAIIKHSHLRSSSLSLSVLDRWEVWILDPSKGDETIQKSLLSSLRPSSDTVGGDCHPPQYNVKVVPRLPFTRLSSILVKDGFCLAGFGNTIGMILFSAS